MEILRSLDAMRKGSAAEAIIDQGTAGPQLHDCEHAQYKLGAIFHK